MPTLLKRVYHKLPLSLRQSSGVIKIKSWIQSHLLPHDWIYDAAYYDTDTRKASLGSVPVMAEWIVRDLQPKRVIDIGCGTGQLIEALQKAGCEVAGLERSKVAIESCHSRHLPVRAFDLEMDDPGQHGQYDVVVSMEVAEHLPQRVADRYVDVLTSMGPTIVFTAAPPGQGGTDHVNEQPPEYWHAKFAQRGFELDGALSDQWRQGWEQSGQVALWYHRNLMIFRRRDAKS